MKRNGKRMVKVKGRKMVARDYTPTEEVMRDRFAAAKRRRILDEQRAESVR